MSEKYTREDLIIWPDEPRAREALGKNCYFGNGPINVLENANADESADILSDIEVNRVEPFKIGNLYWSCIILKKEPEKKIVPFDLSRKEVRNSLRDKWVIMGTNNSNKMFETKIVGFYRDIDLESPYEVLLHGVESGVDAASFLRDFTFLDGSPCGVEVEE